MSKMNITAVFISRNSDDETYSTPELLVAWDNYSIDNHPEGFEKAIEEGKKELGSDLKNSVRVNITVDEDAIRNLLNPSGTITGEITPA